jgi:general L-amino acid transport system substrate-binding protein
LGLKLRLTNDGIQHSELDGNYAGFERNLGESTQTFIPRGLNSSYLDGGLLYSPPFR